MKTCKFVLLSYLIPTLTFAAPSAKNPSGVLCDLDFREGEGKFAFADITEANAEGEQIGASIATADGTIDYWTSVKQTGCSDCDKSWGHDYETSLKFSGQESGTQERKHYGLYEEMKLDFAEPSLLRSVHCKFSE